MEKRCREIFSSLPGCTSILLSTEKMRIIALGEGRMQGNVLKGTRTDCRLRRNNGNTWGYTGYWQCGCSNSRGGGGVAVATPGVGEGLGLATGGGRDLV